jgi:hypothetical protein
VGKAGENGLILELETRVAFAFLQNIVICDMKSTIKKLTPKSWALSGDPISEDQLKENLLSVYNSIEKNKPSGVKGRYFKSFTICTTMSPGIKLELNTFK